jgi:hypothetical protein
VRGHCDWTATPVATTASLRDAQETECIGP